MQKTDTTNSKVQEAYLSHSDIQLDTISSAIAAVKRGEVVIVVDDEDRENEGDFICAASCVTPEIINFMASQGRGLICTPIERQRAQEMGLTLMVDNNTALHETAFTVSIDLIGHGCTTGISAQDRATGIRALIDQDTPPEAFARPGHIFPLVAMEGGVLRRAGHTEAAIDLARLAGHAPAGVLVEILNPDGSMARLPQLIKLSKQLDLKIISIQDLIAYRLQHEVLITSKGTYALTGALGGFDMEVFYDDATNSHHLAIKYGSWTAEDDVLVRVYSSTDQDLVLGLLTGTYGDRYHRIIAAIRKRGRGVFLLIRQPEDETTFVADTDAFFELPDASAKGTSSRPQPVKRDIGIGAQILRHLGVERMCVLTNSARRTISLEGFGIEQVGTESF